MTVLVEVVHTVKPLTNAVFDRWVDWYGTDVIPAMERNGFDVIGAWKRTGGPMGQDVLLSRFESVAAYEAAGKALRADPKFLAALAKAAEFQVSESVKVCAFVPYSTEQRLERALVKPEKPRQFLQAVLNLRQGGQAGAYATVGKIADTLEGVGVQLAAAYETSIGQRGELTDIWAFAAGGMDLTYRKSNGFLDELTAELRRYAPEESTYYLSPLPYSKLQ